MVYLVILLLILFGIYYYDYANNKKNYLLVYWGICFLMIVVAGLRYRIGNDSVMYENYFQEFPTLAQLPKFRFFHTRFEPGFVIFCSIFKSITPQFFLVQIVHALIVNVIIFLFIYRNAGKRFFCMLLYYIALYIYFNTEIMRESLAVCCFLLAWPYFKKGKWIKYYLLAILAIFFHTSAFLLLLLPLFWLPALRPLFKLGYRTWFIGIGVFALGIVLKLKFYDIIESISVTSQMSDRAIEYQRDAMGQDFLSVLGYLNIFIRYSLYGIVSLYIYKNLCKRRRVEGKEKNIEEKLEFMVMWQLYFTLISMSIFVLERYTNYFSMFAFVIMSLVFMGPIDLKEHVRKLRPLYWCVAYLPFLIVYFRDYTEPINNAKTLRYYYKYVPYSSILNPERDTKREATFRFYGTR